MIALPASGFSARVWALVLALALLLPLVSLFEPAVRGAAILAIWLSHVSHQHRLALLAAGLLWAPATIEAGMQIAGTGLFTWLTETAVLLRLPPVGPISNIALALGDFVIIGLGLQRAMIGRKSDRFAVFGTLGIVAFIIACHLGLLVPSRVQNWQAELSYLATWRIWVIAFLVSLILAQNDVIKTTLLRTILIVGGLLASAVLLQHAAGDYSYVVDGWLVEEYFLRVRGTYMSHSDVSLAMAFVTISCLVLMSRATSQAWWTLVVAVLLVAAMAFNSTRAVSIGLLCGAVTFSAVMLLFDRRRLVVFLVPCIILGVFSNSIFYDKAATLEPTAAAEDIDKGVFGPAASDRALLLREGFDAVLEKPITGHGAGQLSLPLPGTAFFGALSTYSSHSLLLDITAQVGIPTTALLLIGFGCISLSLLSQARQNKSAASASGLALMATFGATSIFFAEQVDHLQIVFFGLLGILASPYASSHLHDRDNAILVQEQVAAIRLPKTQTSVLAAITFLWVGTNSPGIVLPAVGLVYNQLVDPAYNRTDAIYTNNKAIRRLLDLALWLNGDPRRSILLLDDPDILPTNDAWILWDPTRDVDYPRVRDRLGYTTVRPIYPSPSFRLLPEWSVIPPRYWSEVSVIKAGAAPVLTLPSEVAGEVIAGDIRNILPDEETVFSIDVELPLLSIQVENLTATKAPLLVRLETAAGGFDGITSSDAAQFEHGSAARAGQTVQKIRVPDNLPRGEPVRLVLTSEATIYSRISVQPAVSGNLAPLATLVPKDGADSTARAVADYRWTTPWISYTPPHQLTFDMHGISNQSLLVYGLSTIYYPINPTQGPTAWTVEGSQNGTSWTMVDHQSDSTLTAGAGHKDIFVPEYREEPFRFYRFTFEDSTPEKPLGLTDISLHFGLNPDTTSSTSKR